MRERQRTSLRQLTPARLDQMRDVFAGKRLECQGVGHCPDDWLTAMDLDQRHDLAHVHHGVTAALAQTGVIRRSLGRKREKALQRMLIARMSTLFEKRCCRRSKSA